jgi:hypothetical protein
VLIFNKLIHRTAGQLTEVLGNVLRDLFEDYLNELIRLTGTTREKLGAIIRQVVDSQLNAAERHLKSDPKIAEWRHIPSDFAHEDFVRYHGKPLLTVFREHLRRRAGQALVLIDLLRAVPSLNDASLEAWIERQFTGPVIVGVRTIINRYLDDTPHGNDSRETLLDRAERELIALLEESKSVALVGRFDGENPAREAHRRNFNRRHNPFILVASQVGEEGIDLQEQCRYVIHYDLEWNPARMEQREGRVDRMGWGRASEGYIDVRFLLLKGTYEERIFHTVMQRDQWFQVLIGSKRRELGMIPEEEVEDVEPKIAQDKIEEDGAVGALTDDEKTRVMLDLRPELTDT